MTRDELLDYIILSIDDNNNNEIDYDRMRSVLNGMIDTILPAATAATDGRVPYVDTGAYTSADALKVLAGVVNAQKLALTYGVSYVDYIHNSGTFTGTASRALVTKRYVDGRSTVIGTISVNVPINSELRVGQTVTLDGGISHTIEEGDTFLLKSQTDPAENVPYTAVAADAVPVVAEWYDSTKNQDILIEKGAATKQVMPAVAEGEDPVIETPLQAQQITLLSTGWSGNSYSFDATGVLSILENSNILISPATKADSDLYADAEIFCASQAANTLVFSCVNAPTYDVVLNVIVL